MRRISLVMLALAALALPAGAVAGKDHGGSKKASYELEGPLSAYTAAAGPVDGSVTILVTKANNAGKPFIGQTLTFPISSSTKVEAKGGTIADGTRGKVKIKGAAGLDASGLQALAPKELEAKSNKGNGGPQSTYELRGTLSAYAPAVGATNGSITILVSAANSAGQPFVGQTLTFAVSSATELEPAAAAIADGDRGKVRVKGAPGLDATGLQALVAKEVEDETLDG